MKSEQLTIGVFMFHLFSLLLAGCGNNSDSGSLSTADTSAVLHITEDTIDNCACEVEIYVKYSTYLPVYNEPNDSLVIEFRFEDIKGFDFGKNIHVISSKQGWLQIGDILDTVGGNDLKGKWINSSYSEIGTNNYDGRRIILRAQANAESDSIGYIDVESYFNVIQCCKGWVYIKTHQTHGWLAPEFQCANELTNCS
ncbi:MAG: hypothetical protein KDD36_09000 [Flavobacteriales bacterium]|nr:hypothetical protein [Flavobacteriales bacterium]